MTTQERLAQAVMRLLIYELNKTNTFKSAGYKAKKLKSHPTAFNILREKVYTLEKVPIQFHCLMVDDALEVRVVLTKERALHTIKRWLSAAGQSLEEVLDEDEKGRKYLTLRGKRSSPLYSAREVFETILHILIRYFNDHNPRFKS